MPRTKENPDTGALVFLGLAGIAAYGIYAGWFSSLFGTTTAVTTTTTTPANTTGSTTAAQMGPGTSSNPVSTSTIVNAPGVAQPLGTPITNVNDLAPTAATNPAYIVPTQGILIGTNPIPSGYTSIPVTSGTPAGVVWLRNDILSKDLNNPPNNMITYGPGVLTADNVGLKDLSAGLSGMGARYVTQNQRRNLRGLMGAWG